MPKLPKITSLLFLYNMLRKKWVMQLIFYMKTWRAWWWEWSSILKVLKVTSLQCLYNISKKKLWMEFILEFIKIKTSASWIINFWWKPDMSKVPKKGSLLSFCKIFRKSIVTVFLFYCEAKAFRYFTGFQSCLVLFVFQTFQLSRFCQDSPGFCYSVLVSWIELVCLGFYISHHKNVHIYIIFHQHCKTIHL